MSQKSRDFLKELGKILKGDGPGIIGKPEQCIEFIQEYVSENEFSLAVSASLTGGAWCIKNQAGLLEFFAENDTGFGLVIQGDAVKDIVGIVISIFL